MNRDRSSRAICGVLAAALLVGVAIAARAQGPSAVADPFETAKSKKGLQVELVDDAIALGIAHAAINVDLSRLIAPAANEGDEGVIWRRRGGDRFALRAAYLEGLEATIRPLSDAGVLVYVILLAYESGDPSVDRLLLHPHYDPQAPNHLAAWNTRTPEGRDWLAAAVECLAERWSGGDSSRGRVAGYIVGNEVNSHWFWNNQGRTTLEEVADDYLAAVRLVHAAVRSQAAWPRVYISLDHHWTIPYAGGDGQQCVAGKLLLDRFAKRAKETAGGDFDWHVAYHPYPENLFEPRFWNDKTAKDSPNSPRITFKNLQVLPAYLRRPELLHAGSPRRVILSEQGFHSAPGVEGEAIQAAAFCYAYEKVERLDGIDAFIFHRHVDHPAEGGLNLGLRRREPGASDPYPTKQIYECFRAAGTPRWEAASQFALPLVGLRRWDEISE